MTNPIFNPLETMFDKRVQKPPFRLPISKRLREMFAYEENKSVAPINGFHFEPNISGDKTTWSFEFDAVSVVDEQGTYRELPNDLCGMFVYEVDSYEVDSPEESWIVCFNTTRIPNYWIVKSLDDARAICDWVFANTDKILELVKPQREYAPSGRVKAKSSKRGFIKKKSSKS